MSEMKMTKVKVRRV